MPTPPHSEIVAGIMTDALHTVARRGTILTHVSKIVAPKSGEKVDGKRKLTNAQAAAAARCFTMLAGRLNVRLADACRAAGVASSPNNFRPFHLTRPELELGENFRFGEKRFSRSLNHYHRLVEETIRIAKEQGTEVDRDTVLDELADAVWDFLQPYVPLIERTRFDEISEHLNLIGTYFSTPRRLKDGVVIDLPRFWKDSRKRNLVYDDGTSRMSIDESEAQLGWMRKKPALLRPKVFLLPRLVGRVPVVCETVDVIDGTRDDGTAYARLEATPFGTTVAAIFYEVSLALLPEGPGKARLWFVLDPWTSIPASPRSKDRDSLGILGPGEITVPGFPSRAVAAEDEIGDFVMTANGPFSAMCPDFQTWLDTRVPPESEWDSEEVRRMLPVTPETCELLLGNALNRGADAYLYHWEKRKKSVLPEIAVLPGGSVSEDLVDRMADILYAEGEVSLIGLLANQAIPMMKAMDAFMDQSAQGLEQRKRSFLQRMRS